MIVFDKIGKLLNGKSKGWIIVIQDDTNGETGGYYVLEWSLKDTDKRFDNQYEGLDNRFINIKGLGIEWMDQDYMPKQSTEDEIKKVEKIRELAKKKGFYNKQAPTLSDFC